MEKATEKSRYRLYDKITALLEQINEGLVWSGIKVSTNTEYVPDYLSEVAAKYAELWLIDETSLYMAKENTRLFSKGSMNCCLNTGTSSKNT